MTRRAVLLLFLTLDVGCWDHLSPTLPTIPVPSRTTVAGTGWAIRTPMPTARDNFASAVVNGIIYIIGGNTGGGFGEGLVLATVEAYDPATDTWTSKANMPAPRFGERAAVIDGKIYVVNGQDCSCTPSGQTSTMFIYDPSTNTWTSGPDVPSPGNGGEADAIDGKLYVLSGHNGGDQNTFYRYDPAAGSWSQLPGSPRVHVYGASGVIDGKFYVVGGEGPSVATDVFDPLTGTWDATAPDMPVGTYHAWGGIVGGKLFAYGGANVCETGPFGITKVVLAYDPVARTWSQWPSMLSFRHLLGGGAVNGVIYAIGGYTPDDNGGRVSTNLVESFAPTTPTNSPATAQQACATNQPPQAVIAPSANASESEGSSISFDGTSSSDPDGDVLSYAWDFDGDGVIDATTAQPTFSFPDNGTYTVTLTVSDGHGASSTTQTSVVVANVAPTLGPVAGIPTGPIAAGTALTVTASFTDPGVLDTHTAAIAWDLGLAPVSASVSENRGSGTLSATQQLSVGVYTPAISVTDKDGGTAFEQAPTYIVVYDPSSGFVTGGGWFDSPAGACQLASCTSATTGKASFGFVSSYQKGATVPTGNTEFQFQTGNLAFHSTSYQWLVIAGARAQYKGAGTINGAGRYGFLVTAIDGAVSGGGADAFRIKIWDQASGAVVYDNRMGSGEDSSDATILGGGSIIIHS
jgi:N-acetylneuraminic acid mutarotase